MAAGKKENGIITYYTYATRPLACQLPNASADKYWWLDQSKELLLAPSVLPLPAKLVDLNWFVVLLNVGLNVGNMQLFCYNCYKSIILKEGKGEDS